VIVFAAVFSLLLLGWYLNRKRWRIERKHAQALNEEKERSLQQTLIAQEEERQRIAKDLHDGIVQDLAAIKMNLEQMRSHVSPQQEMNFENARNNLERTTREVREISHQMMRTALRELGLKAAVDDVLRKILPLHHIHHDFFAHGLDERLPEKIEISLFRIVQELLNNIIKHSGATQVNVSITRNKNFVTMHLEDNGKGFDPQQKSMGIGLVNLQSRVRIVNGEIRYESGENTGTVVIVKVPL